MKFSALSLGLLALLTPLTAAWSKEDREIFRVRDELIAHEGSDVTFYEYLGVPKSASHEDINKAYKKKSRLLHPDKVRQQLQAERVKAQKEHTKKGGKPAAHLTSKPPSAGELKAAIKKASERQARLSIVADVLRGPGRDRYDHFLSNGFPTWKGTEYYYNRYRPGLGTAMFGVFLFAGGGAHYLALYMSWKRQREFVERYIKFARHAAWGNNLGLNIPGIDAAAAAAAAAAPPPPPPPPPQQVYEDEEGNQVPMNRKMRRMQEREEKKEASKDRGSGRKAVAARRAKTNNTTSAAASGSATPQPQAPGSGPQGAKKRVVAENGKVLVVDSLGDVYLEQDDEDGNAGEYLLDPNELPQPTFSDTAVVRLPVWAFNLTIGRLLPKRANADAEEYDDDELVQGGGGDAAAPEETDDVDSEPGKNTPSTGGSDFELLEKSVDELGRAKASGSQNKQRAATKRKSKKR
ncbi:hypothetical protein QBC44DRAFT_325599 [Cladorrhinum sp. PSN332]|nr:hypothetical protein QBC44DRAFT_325599 [Cladorrhinum sp. PSN332]